MSVKGLLGVSLLATMMGLAGCATWGSQQYNKQHNQTAAAQKVSVKASRIKNNAYAGDPDAEYALGYMYYYGKDGVSQDQELGREWIAKAAAQGQPQAIEATSIIQRSQHPQAATITIASKAKQPTAAKAAVNKKSQPKKKPRINNVTAAAKQHFTSSEQRLLKTQKRYTLQLLGRHDKKDAEAFVQRNDLSKALIYHTYNKGGDWYVVTYGLYSTDKAAVAAKKRLPQSIRRLSPWVKPLAMVKAEIKKQAGDA